MGFGKEVSIVVVAVVVVAIAMYGLFTSGWIPIAETTTGAIVSTTGLGKLELSSPADPAYCPPSAEVLCDKTDYSATCHACGTSKNAIDVSPNAPTEDVICGPAKFTLKNTGDGTVRGIKVDSWSADSSKVKLIFSAAPSAQWNAKTKTYSSLDPNDQLIGYLYCKYEGGQTSAAEKVDVSVTGVATSGAKEGYKTFTVNLNCTA